AIKESTKDEPGSGLRDARDGRLRACAARPTQQGIGLSQEQPVHSSSSPNRAPSLEKRASLCIQAAAVPTPWEYKEAHDHVDRLFSTTYLLGPRHATGYGGLCRRTGGHGYGAVAAAAARQGTGCFGHDCPTPSRSTRSEVGYPQPRSAAHAGGL